VSGRSSLRALIRQTAHDLWANDVLGLAAQSAYYCFYSLFPILLVCAPLLSLVGDRQRTFAILMDKVARAAPPDAFALVQSVVRSAVFGQGAPGVISVGALLTIWMGSNVFSSLADALNRVAATHKTRPYWKTFLLSLGFVFVAGVAAFLGTVVLLFGQSIVETVGSALDLPRTARLAWAIGQDVVVIALLVALGAAVFRFLPNESPRWNEAIIGSVVATLLWLVATFGFRLYVEHFPNYNRTYGAIGAVIVLLTWMYLSMLAVLIGGELAAELHRVRAHGATSFPSGPTAPAPYR
jgi:membrane protein